MLSRLASLRVWLLVAMLATAVLTLVAGSIITSQLSTASEEAADRANVQASAQAIASQVQAGVDAEELRALQQVLPGEQIIVVRNGKTVFAGPMPTSAPLELTVTAPLPDGHVELRDYHAIPGGLGQGTLVAAVIALVIMGEAWLAATVLVRTVRRPVERAIEAAGRLADGDFSARMGSAGPEEFARLGHAVDAMAAQLQHADSQQKRFLADLVHEIATPVSAVSGFAVALAEGSVQTPEERAEAADIVMNETRRLRQLLDDMRQLNRLELTDSVHRERVDMSVLCAQTAQRFRLAGRDAGVTLTEHAAHAWVDADPRLIDAVLSNFVSNAIRYTRPGGKVEIRASRRRRPPAVVIAVRDTGTGIAAEQLERIFDRLYRTDDARDRATGGSGLGLAIARSAAQTLGARIEVESRPGAGSEFRLVLPAGASAPGNDEPAP
ncbi:MAG TPA: HAMP domain-containing sensor histidine kinase [Trebonia sp.]|nr:HAMP domain-containing sensor histidine kinase [Trebonia sp.]